VTGKKGYWMSEPKSRKHPIALSDFALSALLAHQERQNEERELVGDAWQQEDLVFPNAVGHMMLPSTLYRQFQRRLKKAGLPAIRFHDLRHTIATLLLSHGVNPKLASRDVGARRYRYYPAHLWACLTADARGRGHRRRQHCEAIS
jgi:integrase